MTCTCLPVLDDCNYDGYSSSEYTIAIGAANIFGKSPVYSEHCSNVLVSAYSSDMNVGSDDILYGVASTDVGNRCTREFKGTSASTPQVAAVIALMLEANPSLSWLDVQYVLIFSASRGSPEVDSDWSKNGGGLWNHPKLGFGIVDAAKAVELALTYRYKPRYAYATSDAWQGSKSLNPTSKAAQNQEMISITVTVPKTPDLKSLELVQVTVTFQGPYRGLVAYYLTSPMGTKYMLARSRPRDTASASLNQWTFSSVRYWGERPHGEWTLTLVDRRDRFEGSPSLNPAYLSYVQIRVRGACDTPFSGPCADSGTIMEITTTVLIVAGIGLGLVLVVVFVNYLFRGRRRREGGNEILLPRPKRQPKDDGWNDDEEEDLEGASLVLRSEPTIIRDVFVQASPMTPTVLVSPATDVSIRDHLERHVKKPVRMPKFPAGMIKSMSMPMLAESDFAMKEMRAPLPPPPPKPGNSLKKSKSNPTIIVAAGKQD